MSSTHATLPPQLNVAVRIIENNQERLNEHQAFDAKVATLLHAPEFTHLTDRERVLTIERMLKDHMAALKPLEAVNNVLVNVAQML